MKKTTVLAAAICASLGAVGAYALLGPSSAPTATVTQTAALPVAPDTTAPALKLDAAGDAFALRVERGRRRLSSEEVSRLAELAPSLHAQHHKITGKEPAGNDAKTARQIAFERAFATRMVLAEHGVDPALGRLFYLTRGKGLAPGVEVQTMTGEKLAGLKGVRSAGRIGRTGLAAQSPSQAGAGADATAQLARGLPAMAAIAEAMNRLDQLGNTATPSLLPQWAGAHSVLSSAPV